MFISLAIIITLLSFFLVGIMDRLKDYFHGCEKNVMEQRFVDRINKEKYLEEVGYNVMNDPW